MADFRHRNHKDSLFTAFNGLKIAITTQPNFKIIILSMIIAAAMGMFFEISRGEWMVLVLTFSMVFLAEMINTSLESIVDLVTEEWRENAKIAKDVSGGMVLSIVIFSVVIGLLVFLPRFFQIASLMMAKW